jgi:hypothetical protein
VGARDRNDGDSAARPAPKMLTTTQAARRINLTFVAMVLVAVPLLLISRAVVIWVALLAVWIVLWIGFWVRWGRYWHPIRQFRYEWGGYRQGTFKRSTESEAAYREAWQESGGAPPKLPPPSGDVDRGHGAGR